MWPARARQGAAAAPCRSIAALMRRPSSECLSFRCEGGTDSSRVASEQGGKSGGVIFWHDVCTDGRERVGGTVGLGATDGRTDGRTDTHEERETQTRIRVASQQLPRHWERGREPDSSAAAAEDDDQALFDSVSPTNDDGIKKEGVPTLAYAHKCRSHSLMGPVQAGPKACQ